MNGWVEFLWEFVSCQNSYGFWDALFEMNLCLWYLLDGRLGRFGETLVGPQISWLKQISRWTTRRYSPSTDAITVCNATRQPHYSVRLNIQFRDCHRVLGCMHNLNLCLEAITVHGGLIVVMRVVTVRLEERNCLGLGEEKMVLYGICYLLGTRGPL